MDMVDHAPVKTGADELIDLVSRRGKISLEKAARELRMPLHSVQGMVDFLVEEKILGIEFKFTTQYIYLNEMPGQMHGSPQDLTEGLVTKEDFFKRAKIRGLPSERIELLWRKYLRGNLPRIHDDFIQKAQGKGMDKKKIDSLWQKYLNYL